MFSIFFKKNRKIIIGFFAIALAGFILFPGNSAKAADVTNCPFSCIDNEGKLGNCGFFFGATICNSIPPPPPQGTSTPPVSRPDVSTCEENKDKCKLSTGAEGLCHKTGVGTEAVWNCYNPAQYPEKGGDLGTIGNALYKVFIKVIGVIFYVVFWLFGWLLWLAAQLLGFVLEKPELQQFTTARLVQEGWAFCRDLANMFFALVLIIISFATILRIELYGAKQLLPKLIIAALLINFSLVIAGVLIDFSQVLTKYFIDATKTVGGNSDVTIVLMKGLHITEGFKKEMPSLLETPGVLLDIIVGLFFQIIIVLVTAFTFFAAAILLIVRFVALWFLLILAPLAWLFYILPATSAYWSMWWRSFLKWVFFAPAYAFFLYLAIFLISQGTLAQDVGFKQEQLASMSVSSAILPSMQLVVDYIVIIGFLLGGLITAQKLSVMGASGLYGFAKSMGKGFGRMTGQWAARGAKVPGADWMSKKIGPQAWQRWAPKSKLVKAISMPFRAPGAVKRFAAPLVIPEVWRRAMAGRRLRAEAASFSQSSGRLEDYLSLRFKKSARITEQQRRAGEVSKKQDEFSKMYKTEEQVNHAYQTTKDPIEKEALLRLSTSINAINTLFASLGKNFDPNEFRDYLKTTYGEDEGARIGADLSAAAASNGNFSLVGTSKWDPDKNKMVFASPAEQKEAALAKSLEMESQQWATRVHPDSFFERTGKDIIHPRTGAVLVKKGGYTGKLHDFGKSFVQNINGGHINQVGRLQGRALKTLFDNISEIRGQAATRGLNPNQVKLIKDFADAIENRYLNKDTPKKQEAAPKQETAPKSEPPFSSA